MFLGYPSSKGGEKMELVCLQSRGGQEQGPGDGAAISLREGSGTFRTKDPDSRVPSRVLASVPSCRALRLKLYILCK